MNQSLIELIKFGQYAVLKIGDESIGVKDYKIVSSLDGGVEIDVKIALDSYTIQFESSTTKEWPTQQHLQSTNDAP